MAPDVVRVGVCGTDSALQVAKKIGIQLTDLLREALRTAQLRQLFNHFAVGGRHTEDGTGQVGKRARTMDFKEFSLALEHLDLFKSLSRFEAHQVHNLTRCVIITHQHGFAIALLTVMLVLQFFKVANTAEDTNDDDVSELIYPEFQSCMENICEKLEIQLDDLIHSNVIDTLKGLDPRAGARFSFQMNNMSSEQRQEFLDCGLGLAELFSLTGKCGFQRAPLHVPQVHLLLTFAADSGADEGAIDVSQLLLSSCHNTANFSELNNESTKLEYGSHGEVVRAFTTYADCACRLAESMVKDEMEKMSRRTKVQEVNLQPELIQSCFCFKL